MTIKSERSENIDWDLLGLYMNDHVAGATAGIARVTRMAQAYRDTPHAQMLTAMAKEFREERQFYYDLLDRFGLGRRTCRQLLAWTGEKVGRAKLNGALIGTSPMTPVFESELLRAAVLGKIGGWESLTAYREELAIPAGKLEGLIEQARRQIDELSTMHQDFRATAFRAERSG